MKLLEYYLAALDSKPKTVQADFVRWHDKVTAYMKEIGLATENCEEWTGTQSQIRELQRFRSYISESHLSYYDRNIWWCEDIIKEFIENDAAKAEERYEAEISSEGVITLVFRDCTIQEINLGDFEVSIDTNHSEGYFRFCARGIGNNAWDDTQSFLHPHISRVDDEDDYADFCIGDQRRLIETAIRQGRIMDACQVIWHTLCTYGSNPYHKLDYWIGRTECPICHRSTSETRECASCNDIVCENCSSICPECEETVCANCDCTCITCAKPMCSDCVKSCEICGESICSECTFVAITEGESVIACETCYKESLV